MTAKYAKPMRILNLYAGIGGNRKLWGDEHEIVAVEFDPAIAHAYQDRFPNDTVIVGDAKQYLLDHYKEFDFIWGSPRCQPHTRLINSQYTRDSYKPEYPDMSLYEIILFLQGHGRKCKWVIENVLPYYTPLVKPTVELDRHLYWSNFDISPIETQKDYVIKFVTKKDAPINLDGYRIKDQRQVIRNQVNADIGKHIFDCAMGTVQHKQGGLFDEETA